MAREGALPGGQWLGREHCQEASGSGGSTARRPVAQEGALPGGQWLGREHCQEASGSGPSRVCSSGSLLKIPRKGHPSAPSLCPHPHHPHCCRRHDFIHLYPAFPVLSCPCVLPRPLPHAMTWVPAADGTQVLPASPAPFLAECSHPGPSLYPLPHTRPCWGRRNTHRRTLRARGPSPAVMLQARTLGSLDGRCAS